MKLPKVSSLCLLSCLCALYILCNRLTARIVTTLNLSSSLTFISVATIIDTGSGLSGVGFVVRALGTVEFILAGVINGPSSANSEDLRDPLIASPLLTLGAPALMAYS